MNKELKTRYNLIPKTASKATYSFLRELSRASAPALILILFICIQTHLIGADITKLIFCIIYTQPESDDEILLCQEQWEDCPVDSIGFDA